MGKLKVNILGEEWKIKYKNLKDDYDGRTDYTNKTIIIRKNNINGLGNFKELQKLTLKHEIIHAFMCSSGLRDNWQHPNEFGHDETTVDWFAMQWSKINKVFKELGIEEV